MEGCFCNESHEKETKCIQVSSANLLHIKTENLDSCTCGHCKNESRDIDSLCCREVYVMIIASAKISEHQGSISPFSFYG